MRTLQAFVSCNRMALYIQDDFKVMPALTLNLGMRWAYTEPVIEKDNRQSNFDLSTGRQILPDDSDHTRTFEPRTFEPPNHRREFQRALFSP